MCWFILCVGICGLPVNFTRAFQVKTVIQGTADAAALAAVIDLPRQDNAIASAIRHAELNMPPEIYGPVLSASDVELGKWDADNRFCLPDTEEPDAVRVNVRRTMAQGNPIYTNFPRDLGLQSWDLTTHAIAQTFTPRRFTDGLIAHHFYRLVF